jgi:hypothetical protein
MPRSGKTERDGTDPAFNGSDMYPVRSNPLAEDSHEAVLAEPDRPFFLDLSLMSGRITVRPRTDALTRLILREVNVESAELACDKPRGCGQLVVVSRAPCFRVLAAGKHRFCATPTLRVSAPTPRHQPIMERAFSRVRAPAGSLVGIEGERSAGVP